MLARERLIRYAHFTTSPPAGFELTTLEMIDIDCTGSYKSNYHTITTMTCNPSLVSNHGRFSDCKDFYLSVRLLLLFIHLYFPILFQYRYKNCYSDSRTLRAVMKAGGLAFYNLIQHTIILISQGVI
jgi:hypothetical protein